MYLQVARRTLGWVARRLALVAVLCPALAIEAVAGEVEPLEVPRGVGPRPEANAHLDARERIEIGLEAQWDRGFQERPVLAWSLLESARDTSDPAAIERALKVAPGTPAVLLGAAERGVWPGGPLVWSRAFASNFPALVWLISVLAVSVGCAVLIAAGVACLLALCRVLTAYGHLLGHRLPLAEPPIWPGGLAVVAALALLAAVGLGPGAVITLGGMLAIAQLPRSFAIATAVLVGTSGLALGPGLDGTARLLAQPSARPALLAAWRFDWSQPLPGDEIRLERAAERDTEPSPLLVHARANALKHQGEVERALALLEERPPATSALLEARSSNLEGILLLALGRVTDALGAFERARAAGESAAVLYNLAQTYARNVDLIERGPLFAAARAADPERVSTYAAFDGTNVHRYLIYEPLPVGEYLARAMDDTPEAKALAEGVRARVLGPMLPGWAWLAWPLLAGVAFALRGECAGRCRRCDRSLCPSCLPVSPGGSCRRCERLFSDRAKVDARVRKQQIDLERRNQRWLRYRRAAGAFVFPGVGPWLEGRGAAGALRALAAGLAGGLVVAGAFVPVPFEVGDVRGWVVWAGAGSGGLLLLVETWCAYRALRSARP